MGLKILYAEDNFTFGNNFLNQMKEFLPGVKIIWRKNSTSAFRTFLGIGEKENIEFDAVVTDYMMPYGNGDELIDLIRRENPVIPIIGLSSEDTCYYNMKKMAIRNFDFFNKNMSLFVLSKKLVEMVEEYRRIYKKDEK